MTIEMTTSLDTNLVYLIDQIRSNLLIADGNEILKETPRAHAWLLTTLSIYGEKFSVLLELYRLFREQNSYILLSFIIEHILQHHINEIDKNTYLQQEFQLIFTNSSNNSIEKDNFSYSRLYSLLSLSTREIISSILIHKWYNELEQNLLLSINSNELLNQCREKALACLSLSSSSISSILQLIINTEDKIGFKTKLSSLNILRCLFVQDLLPIILKNRQGFGIQSHLCHKWLIYAIEFYIEYLVNCIKYNQIKYIHIKLEGNFDKTFYCENPIEQIEILMNLAINAQENFNWQQLIIHQANQIGSSNRRQKLLELRILIDRDHNSTIRCPLECFIFCTSFPIYIQSIVSLSSLFNNEIYKDYIFLYSTVSLKTLINKTNEINNLELIENFSLFIECLNLLQQSQINSCVKIYQEILDKIHFNSNIQIYQRLLKIFYFYYVIQKIKDNKSITETNQNKTIVIDDTPQSPTMQDDSVIETNSIHNKSSLIVPDIENLIQQLNDNNSLESRLQLCSIYSITHLSHQHHITVSFCIDTLMYLHENYRSYDQEQILLPISSDYCFISRSYKLFFNYVLDIILQHISPTLILLQIEQQRSSSLTIYPKNLFHTLTPMSLRYIYDQKLLGQLIKYIQTTTTKERRWITINNNKRKLDDNDDSNKLTDEQFIEKIIQHVSNITQWTDEQRRHAIYTYIIDERQTLLHGRNIPFDFDNQFDNDLNINQQRKENAYYDLTPQKLLLYTRNLFNSIGNEHPFPYKQDRSIAFARRAKAIVKGDPREFMG
ncbi:unnamed protein product [Adineta steineri]|uniref:Uncharacterized protein n=1 Tax=Adineta steineri TaxID=433720 RepID=A0A818MKW9_9BILA|nr:unnamed protein product [Adineta steineri]